MLLGYARGKVGSMVFVRSKGEQITKAYNGNPLNPRTNRQVKQRASFANNVKFFTRGIQNLFKFAYEDRKDNESDFNAFMRHNKQRGVLISKQGFDNVNYPALGKYMLSRGSLSSPKMGIRESEILFLPINYLEVPGLKSSDDHGSLSEKLKSAYNLKNGDYVTILQIAANGSTIDNTPMIVPDERENVTWKVSQFVIDPTSQLEINLAANNSTIYPTKNALEIESTTGEIVGAVAVIFSRETSRKLRCSTSYIENNYYANMCIGQTDTIDYIERVCLSWQGVEESILQGGVVPNNPVYQGYQFEFYLDEACKHPAIEGVRANRVFCKVNQTYERSKQNYYFGNRSYKWQYMEIYSVLEPNQPEKFKIFLWDDEFQSSALATRPKKGDIIALAQKNSQTITIGPRAINEFNKIEA